MVEAEVEVHKRVCTYCQQAFGCSEDIKQIACVNCPLTETCVRPKDKALPTSHGVCKDCVPRHEKVWGAEPGSLEKIWK